MRTYFEDWIESGEERQLGEAIGYPEEVVIDWTGSRNIMLNGIVILDKDKPMVKELEGLHFKEEVDPADILLMKVIGSMYRFDVPASRNGWQSQGALKTNEVFRRYPMDYYEQVSLHNHNPWLQRKLMLDIYIYSKLATNKIWEDWSHSKLGKDSYLLHKPKAAEPFSVVFKEEYLWE